MQHFKRRFKMGRFIIFVSVLVGLTVFLTINTMAQTSTTPVGVVDSTKNKVETFANVGLTSQYVWRGALLDGKPNIQPVLGLVYGNFELGTIGSLSTMNNYYEVDLYASYKFKSIKLSITDFYFDFSGTNSQSYFNYSDTMGYHHILADLSIGGTEKFPLKLTASTILYSGYDVDSTSKSKYTTYLEARYLCKDWELFVGTISGQSDFYLNTKKGFNVVNVGALYNYKLKFNKDYSLPAMAQICVNPAMEKIYLTFSVIF